MATRINSSTVVIRHLFRSSGNCAGRGADPRGSLSIAARTHAGWEAKLQRCLAGKQ